MSDTDSYSPTALVVALCRFSGVTPRLFEALLRHFDAPDSILKAGLKQLMAIEGITAAVAEEVASASDHLARAEEYVGALKQRDIHLLTRLDEEYPRLLFELNDPPPLLYVRGRLPDLSKKTVALVGTHRAGAAGIQMASTLAKEFARAGVQVVSTMVGGIDVAAHLACRAAGGESFAVLDCGFDRIALAEGMPVAIDIVGEGGVISEYPPDMEASDQTLPQVNRLVVGLSQAVVVTEVYGNSVRTLDLLKSCQEVGKLVFFVIDPEHGAHADETSLAMALQYGAIPIQGCDKVEDIIRSLV